jgi:proline iminopeptidase
MDWKRIAVRTAAVALLALMALLLVPRSYDVPAIQPRAGTHYWELSTGSKIGYFKVKHTGTAEKTPILYVHGGPGGAVRDALIEALRPFAARGHDLYFYDQIGSGHSARLSDISEYTVERHSADLQAIIEQIGASKIILVGHSWGCMLLVNWLQNYSTDPVEKVIFEVPGPILPVNPNLKSRMPDPRLGLTNPHFANSDATVQTENFRTCAVRTAATWGIKLATDREMDAYATHLNQAWSRSTTCGSKRRIPPTAGTGYYAHYATVKSFNSVPDRRAALSSLDFPVLVIKAQCDNQPWGFTSEYLDFFNNAELKVLEKSGHDIATENPYAYLQAILDFL